MNDKLIASLKSAAEELRARPDATHDERLAAVDALTAAGHLETADQKRAAAAKGAAPAAEAPKK